MTPQNLSSGDLIADRRADYARMFAEAGDFASASDVMRQALDLAPTWAAGWFKLGTYAEKAGDLEAASEAFRRVLRLTGRDVFGAGLKLALLGHAGIPPVAPSAFVERLFDGYAARFDAALVERLGYSVPETLTELILEIRGADAAFARAVDLGCGTGLMGERLRARVSYMEGYDLSSGMLAQAREKGIYDHLATCDLSLDPAMSRVFGSGTADLVTATDVLIYLGDLRTVFQAAAALLAPGGLFAFSVERAPEDIDWQLQQSLRYCHGEAYVRRLADQNGFTVAAASSAALRRDGTETIAGLLFVLERRGGDTGASAEPAVVVSPASDETAVLH